MFDYFRPKNATGGISFWIASFLFRFAFLSWVVACLMLGWLRTNPVGELNTMGAQVFSLLFFIYPIVLMPILGLIMRWTLIQSGPSRAEERA